TIEPPFPYFQHALIKPKPPDLTAGGFVFNRATSTSAQASRPLCAIQCVPRTRACSTIGDAHRPPNSKAPRLRMGLFFNRATSYSPTHSRVQYHRGWEA